MAPVGGQIVSEPVLDVKRVKAAYGERIVLDDVCLDVPAGEWFVLLGPNGCGKSTLLDCIAGRKSTVAGSIRIAGHSLQDSPLDAKMALGYGCAPDALPLLLSAKQCLEIHASAKRVANLGADLMQLAEDLRLTPYWDCFVDTLSLGTRQKLAIILALVGDPLLIVLDEAFNGLDPASAQILKRHLRSRLADRGVTLVLATHSLDIVEHHADRAGLLVDGRLKRIWQPHELAQMRTDRRRFDDALAESLSSRVSN